MRFTNCDHKVKTIKSDSLEKMFNLAMYIKDRRKESAEYGSDRKVLDIKVMFQDKTRLYEVARYCSWCKSRDEGKPG
jgi:hypothetical protein